jgi:hypothetical protein
MTACGTTRHWQLANVRFAPRASFAHHRLWNLNRRALRQRASCTMPKSHLFENGTHSLAVYVCSLVNDQ